MEQSIKAKTNQLNQRIEQVKPKYSDLKFLFIFFLRFHTSSFTLIDKKYVRIGRKFKKTKRTSRLQATTIRKHHNMSKVRSRN
jgi:hypothetical protein